jgi:hypothetical protein
MYKHWLAVALLLLVLDSLACTCRPAWGYNPPVDKVGPLTVKLEGPAEVSQIEQSIPIGVVIENEADQAISGVLRLGVIDQWTVEPATPTAWQVAGRATVRLTVQVKAGKGSYAAHYPVHAFVEFGSGGVTRVAHPILIIKTTFANPPRATVPVPWKPLHVAADSTLALWELPMRRMIVHVFGEQPLLMPAGTIGSEPRSRADVGLGRETLESSARSVLIMHPPWWEGRVGTVALEFPLTLPDVKPISLTFANAMNPGGQSDGVTFRVRVAPWDTGDAPWGEVVYERHTDAKSWQEASVDLSAFAGRAVRLQLESHPGPKNNTGWDRSFWAEPTLIVGTPQPADPFPPSDEQNSQLLGEIRGDGEVYAVRLWPGRRGLLDSTVCFDDGQRRLFFRGFEVTVLGARLDQPQSPVRLLRVEQQPAEGGLCMRHTFETGDGTFDVIGSLSIESNVLRARFAIANAPPPRPWFDVHLEDVALGRWSHDVSQVYAGTGNVLRKPREFRLSFDGHRLSTSFVGYDFEDTFSLVEAVDTPPLHLDVQPARQHASLHASDDQTRTLIPTGNVWSAVKRWRQVDGRSAAAGVERTAGRFVFDLWGGRYASSTQELKKSFRYGLTDAMVIWHNWQRWGYDYRLPEIYPPNPQFGTENEMRDLIQACREAGVPVALHDNYIDYYPDAKGFSYRETIAYGADGAPVRAWLNEGRNAQSYRYRSDCVEPILKDNLRMIRDNLNPSAYFIDVWSSVRPYDYWTADGKYFNAVYSRNTWGELFAWIREHLGENAPQISESGHDQLIGWLDGAQANHLRVGQPAAGDYSWAVWDWNCDDSERIPWYDAAYHDRFILHGAGYETRYAAGLDTRLHGIHSDDYITTEIMTGHPAMVPGAFDRQVVRKYWLTQDVMRALALRTIESVEFVENDLHRQHIQWSGGGHVWVNRGESDWPIENTTLPQYGFLARIPTEKGLVVAAIERRDGLIVESCLSPSAHYVNARSLADMARPPRDAANDPYAARFNADNRVADFGIVATRGGCRVTRDGQTLVVTPLPDTREEFDVTIRWDKLPWSLPQPSTAEAVGLEGQVLTRLPLERDGNVIRLRCTPNAFAYRLEP